MTDETLFDEEGFEALPGDEGSPPVEPAPSPSRQAKRPRGARPAGVAKTPPRVTKKQQQLDELTADLVSECSGMFGMLAMVMPTTGHFCVEGTPRAMAAVVELCKDNSAMLDGLHKVAKAAPGITLGKFMVGAAVAVQVDFGRIDPGSFAARSLGVTESWLATHEPSASEPGIYVATPPPVPAFHTV